MCKINAVKNKRRLHNIFTVLICIFILAGCAAQTVTAAETRGLTVVAKDRDTNQSAEVKLYNKSYAVIIGIDRYPNFIVPTLQRGNAACDAPASRIQDAGAYSHGDRGNDN